MKSRAPFVFKDIQADPSQLKMNTKRNNELKKPQNSHLYQNYFAGLSKKKTSQPSTWYTRHLLELTCLNRITETSLRSHLINVGMVYLRQKPNLQKVS